MYMDAYCHLRFASNDTLKCCAWLAPSAPYPALPCPTFSQKACSAALMVQKRTVGTVSVRMACVVVSERVSASSVSQQCQPAVALHPNASNDSKDH